ncbi:hypothetical protein RRF56_09835 [Nodosilinea sp. E11]|nr:hypothetical protein RRF56_09835 [Nodosilinea sp. E11]
MQVIPGTELRQILNNYKVEKYSPRFVTLACDLLIDGFPRSANTYLYYYTQLSFPDIKIAHHIHSWQHFLFSKVFGIFSVMVVREPDLAVNSIFAKRKGHISLYYIEYIITNAVSMFLADYVVLFSDVINEQRIKDIMTKISQKIGKKTIDFPSEKLIELMESRTNKKNIKTPDFCIENLSFLSKVFRNLAFLVYESACKRARR